MPYWFCNEEVARIQERNYPFFKSDDVEGMLKACFRTPKDQEEGRWMTIADIFKVLQEQYPMLIANHRTKIRIGQAMKFLNCERKRTNKGTCLLSLFKNGENILKSMWKTFIKRVLSQQSV